MSEIVIVEYERFKEDLEVAKVQCDFLPDTSTKEGYEKSKRVALDNQKPVTALEKARVAAKAYWMEGGRQVDAQAKQLKKEFEEYILPHKEAYKKLDNEKKEREVKRKADLEERVNYLLTLAEAMADSDSESIAIAAQQVNDEDCEGFFEFTENALKARNKARNDLALLLERKLKEEKDAKDLAELRAKQAAQEIKDREEEIRREASEEADRLKREAIEREEAAKREAIESEQRRIEAEKHAELNRVEAEKNAKVQAEQAAEYARLAEVARQEQEAESARLEQQRREADKAHTSNILRAAKESLIVLDIDEETAKKIVLAIRKNQITNVTINY